MLQSFLIATHLLLCAGIVTLVLIQRGKGADAGAGFGPGASGTVFGARGAATFFSKATAVLATLFFVTSIALTYVAGKPAAEPESSVLDSLPEQQPAPMGEVPVLDSAPAPEPSGEK